MKSTRPELKEYYGENVGIKGLITKISTQRGIHIDRKTILLKKVKIKTPNKTLKFDHMWFTIPSYIKAYKNQMLSGSGTVACYQRRTTAYDYTIKLNDSITIK